MALLSVRCYANVIFCCRCFCCCYNGRFVSLGAKVCSKFAFVSIKIGCNRFHEQRILKRWWQHNCLIHFFLPLRFIHTQSLAVFVCVCVCLSLFSLTVFYKSTHRIWCRWIKKKKKKCRTKNRCAQILLTSAIEMRMVNGDIPSFQHSASDHSSSKNTQSWNTPHIIYI